MYIGGTTVVAGKIAVPYEDSCSLYECILQLIVLV